MKSILAASCCNTPSRKTLLKTKGMFDIIMLYVANIISYIQLQLHTIPHSLVSCQLSVRRTNSPLVCYCVRQTNSVLISTDCLSVAASILISNFNVEFDDVISSVSFENLLKGVARRQKRYLTGSTDL